MDILATLLKRQKSKGIGSGCVSLFNKLGEFNIHARHAVKTSKYKGNKVYPITFNHKVKSFKDRSPYILQILFLINEGYETGNDAPRGGRCGDYIETSEFAIKLLKALKKL